MMMQTRQRNSQVDWRGNFLSAAWSFAGRVNFVVGLLVLGGALLGVPGKANAQMAMHEITWAHGSPNEVVRFVVFASATSGDLAGAREVYSGKPANSRIEGGNSVYSALISVDLLEYVAVAAVALDGSLSALSEWSGLPPSTPGQPFYIP